MLDIGHPHRRERPPSGSAARAPRRRRRPGRTERRSHGARLPHVPSARTPRASTRSGGRGGACVPAGSDSNVALYSAFGVRDDDRGWRRVLEHDPLERLEPRRLDVLDDLDRHRRVEAGETRVAVGERRLEELQPRPRGVAHRVEAAACARRAAAPGRTRRRPPPARSRARRAGRGQHALAAAEVADAPGAGGADDGEHRGPALLAERGRAGRAPRRSGGRRARCPGPPAPRRPPRPAGRARPAVSSRLCARYRRVISSFSGCPASQSPPARTSLSTSSVLTQ